MLFLYLYDSWYYVYYINDIAFISSISKYIHLYYIITVFILLIINNHVYTNPKFMPIEFFKNISIPKTMPND